MTNSLLYYFSTQLNNYFPSEASTCDTCKLFTETKIICKVIVMTKLNQMHTYALTHQGLLLKAMIS